MGDFDLPFTPCYNQRSIIGDSTKYNCGLPNCEGQNQNNLNSENCPEPIEGEPQLYQGVCWGRDSNYSTGISIGCPEGVLCSSDFNPATNTYGAYLGCDITENNAGVDCMEFEKVQDLAADCSGSCWVNGGRAEINQKCSNLFRDQASCNSMFYFCEWKENGAGGSCQAVGEFDDTPLQTFSKKYNTIPNPSPNTINIVSSDHISSPNNLVNHSTLEVRGTIPENETWYLTNSQSAWDSSKRTSYDPNTYISCLHKCGSPTSGQENCTKDCLAVPRCQFVEDPTECVIKDISDGPAFMCSKNVNNLKSGYCTWCLGTARKEPYEPSELSGAITREPNEWKEIKQRNGTQRCERYNFCEVENSEALWNECRDEILQSNPTIEKGELKKQCEDKLRYLTRVNKNLVVNPINPKTYDSPCTSEYTWYHTKVTSPNGDDQEENYLCTWCPSLQCPPPVGTGPDHPFENKCVWETEPNNQLNVICNKTEEVEPIDDETAIIAAGAGGAAVSILIGSLLIFL